MVPSPSIVMEWTVAVPSKISLYEDSLRSGEFLANKEGIIFLATGLLSVYFARGSASVLLPRSLYN
jgi:hypothetical protein